MTSDSQSDYTNMSLEDAVRDVEDLPIPATDLSAPNHPPCSICDQPATGNCGRCHNMWYCSKTCTENDKLFHQDFCKQIMNLKASPVYEGRSYFRTIYFPASEDFPQIVWLEHVGHETMFNSVQMDRLMDGPHAAYVKFDCHRELRRSLGYQIEIIYGTEPVTDSTDRNRSLTHLLPGNSPRHWKRPLLARGVDPQTGMPKDLDTNAVPAILAFLTWMSNNNSIYPGKVYALDTVMGDMSDPPVQQ